MKKLHHNTLWVDPSVAAALTGHHPVSFRRWGADGLIKVRVNPRKKVKGAWQYYLPDIKELLGIH